MERERKDTNISLSLQPKKVIQGFNNSVNIPQIVVIKASHSRKEVFDLDKLDELIIQLTGERRR